ARRIFDDVTNWQCRALRPPGARRTGLEYDRNVFDGRLCRFVTSGELRSESMNTKESNRRRVLKTAAAAAAGVVASADASGQNPAARKPLHTASKQNDSADGGLWITWYDLPDTGRETYLSWLHEKYLPALLKRPGYLWAAHYATRGTQETAGEVRLHHV